MKRFSFYMTAVICLLVSQSISAQNQANGFIPPILSLVLDDDRVELKDATFDLTAISTGGIDLSNYFASTAFSEQAIGTGTSVALGRVVDPTQGAIMFVTDENGEPLFVSYHSGEELSTGNAAVSIQSIADGLIMMSPLLLEYSREDKAKILLVIKQLDSYTAYVDYLAAIIAENPTQLLEAEDHPDVYVTAANLIIEAFESAVEPVDLKTALPYLFAGANASPHIGSLTEPYIVDESDNEVSYVNDTNVYYGIEEGGNALLLPAKDAVLTVEITDFPWKIERIGFAEPAFLNSTIPDGTTDVFFIRDGPSAGTASKAAFAANALKGACDVLDAVAFCPYTSDLIISNVNRFVIGSSSETDLNIFLDYYEQQAARISSPLEWFGFVVDILTTKVDGSETATYFNLLVKVFYKGKLSSGSAAKHFKATKRVLAGAGQALKVLSYAKFANSGLPFFYDLITTPNKYGFCINSNSGVLTEACAHSAPKAEFSTDLENSNPKINESVEFDANASFDTMFENAQLEFRWDFTGDGVYEEDWALGNDVVSFTFTEQGSYDILLEVRNPSGRVGRTSRSLVAGSISQQLRSGLVGHYSFGLNGADSSGHSAHAVASGGVTYVPGVLGSAASFDGVDDSFTVSKSEPTEFNAQDDFSISVWMEPALFNDTLSFLTVLEKPTNQSGSPAYSLAKRSLGMSGGGPDNVLGTQESNQLDGPVLSHGSMSHVVFLKRDDLLEVYVAGEKVSDGIAAEWANSSELPLLIGVNGQGGDRYKGLMDELRIYSRALSTDEIKALYDAGEDYLIYRDDELQIVHDRRSNLAWLDNSGRNSKVKFNIAHNYCSNLSIGEYSNWRQPSIQELEAIVDLNNSPKTNLPFQTLLSDVYFSTSRSATHKSCPTIDGHSNWVLHFGTGQKVSSVIYSWRAFCNVGGYSNSHYYTCVHQ